MNIIWYNRTKIFFTDKFIQKNKNIKRHLSEMKYEIFN